MRCEHYACRCARAAELAAMGMIREAIDVHYQQVECRSEAARKIAEEQAQWRKVHR